MAPLSRPYLAASFVNMLLSPKHMSVQNGAMDVRQSDATGRMRLTSVISPAHVCVHSTTQARSQDFPRGGGLIRGESGP